MILEAGGHQVRYDYAKTRSELNEKEFGKLCMVLNEHFICKLENFKNGVDKDCG